MSLGEKHRTTFPLRLPASIKNAANLMALKDGVSLNYFITVAVAEKISRLEQAAVARPDLVNKQRAVPPATGTSKLTFYH
jgi:hypothetical protein